MLFSAKATSLAGTLSPMMCLLIFSAHSNKSAFSHSFTCEIIEKSSFLKSENSLFIRNFSRFSVCLQIRNITCMHLNRKP